jgi:hypothetical protein
MLQNRLLMFCWFGLSEVSGVHCGGREAVVCVCVWVAGVVVLGATEENFLPWVSCGNLVSEHIVLFCRMICYVSYGMN